VSIEDFDRLKVMMALLSGAVLAFCILDKQFVTGLMFPGFMGFLLLLK